MIRPGRPKRTSLSFEPASRSHSQALSYTRYLELLRNISTNISRIPNATRKEMSASPFLLGSRRVKLNNLASSKLGAGDEDDFENVWELSAPSKILVLDDSVAHLLFQQFILAAPEESSLEDFYLSLGARRLSCKTKIPLPLLNPPLTSIWYSLRQRRVPARGAAQLRILRQSPFHLPCCVLRSKSRPS